MPDYCTHIAVGAPVGLTCAFANSLNQGGLNITLEAFGGWWGGTAAAVLPDLFDPPSHPGHRAMGHGICPVVAGSLLWAGNLRSWQDGLRCLADRHRAQEIWAEDVLAALGHLLAEWLLRFLAGFVAGFGAGYISHIMLDYGTPRGLPFVA
jgi:LexA-binding, inner membrane-associated putative hydrolase